MLKPYFELRQQFETGKESVVDTINELLKEIDNKKDLNAFITLTSELAKKQAVISQENFDSGKPRTLEGMVLAIKDNISTKDIRTTCASKMLENYIPIYNATSVQKLVDAGAIIIGKTNMDEFAMGSSNENSYFGNVLNPLNKEYVPGGSSGGSAAAVSAGLCHVSLGSETGGSVRQPASFTGIFGYKPSYGRISRFGLVAFASSLDQIGIFCNNLVDLSSVCDIITGVDENDSTSANLGPTRSSSKIENIYKNLRIGYVSDEVLNNCTDYVTKKYRSDLNKLKEEGHELIEIPIHYSEAWIPTYYIIATAEASSNLARFDGVRFGFRPELNEGDNIYVKTRSNGFGMEVKRRIMLGTYVLSSGFYDAYYRKAQQVRRKITDSYKSTFDKVDMVYMPTTPGSAFKFGSRNENPIKMYKADFYTASANLAGVPAINIPSGLDDEGMPFGMQIQCNNFEDEKMIGYANYISKLINS
ncbi:MAG: Asp-tRNA(Asn)/Glu-tRNA(Gln) amidotransferase subunit GatA [Candidatus Kapaibacterium sp.]|nr:Asp-tRNA(Asn)/Glu-tRNA(Gln) amidotransferase subunit GatA [Ignavibacteriota bacterium]MCB9220731.1 Asp-tRNA(Asn)/Glu-tRNA(Gln) amidotransferase subunit GatA [Ignavibacteria bacterium]